MRSTKPKKPAETRRTPSGDVRCECGALLFRALGPVQLEMKCRRCARMWRFGPG
jgi:hypothetical protein